MVSTSDTSGEVEVVRETPEEEEEEESSRPEPEKVNGFRPRQIFDTFLLSDPSV